MQSHRSISCSCALIAALALAGPAANAQPAKGAAEAAFQKGKQLMAAGDLDAACAAFAQSAALDPQLGTQYNLGLCYEQAGKIASAWLAFAEVAAKDTNAKRKADSAKRAKALEPRVPRLRLETGDRAPGLVVHLGDTDVTVTLGVDTPVDPGHYTITASAVGRKPWSTTIDVAPGGTATITIAPLASGADPARPEGPLEFDNEPPRNPHPGRVRHVLGASVGVAGVAALGASVFFGSQARSHQRDAEQACGGSVAPCDPSGLDAANAAVSAARDRATYANIAAATGAVLVGVGVVLYVTAPRGERPRAAMRPVVAPDQVGVVFDGRF
ncbi:MAG: carboxypeptidase-like regulatory domain-containing protein [Deltaproteobacteria bacterium]|nr:carboxypeptidase-like regulatory domain-containing protein [Deltaproteobacteria bacterium]